MNGTCRTWCVPSAIYDKLRWTSNGGTGIGFLLCPGWMPTVTRDTTVGGWVVLVCFFFPLIGGSGGGTSVTGGYAVKPTVPCGVKVVRVPWVGFVHIFVFMCDREGDGGGGWTVIPYSWWS